MQNSDVLNVSDESNSDVAIGQVPTSLRDSKATFSWSAFGGADLSFLGPSAPRSLCDRPDLPFRPWRDATPTFDAGGDAEDVGNIDDIGRAPLDDGEVDQGV